MKSQDFYIDMEESANTPRITEGHCLEGIEGRGRTILLRYDLVPSEERIPGTASELSESELCAAWTWTRCRYIWIE